MLRPQLLTALVAFGLFGCASAAMAQYDSPELNRLMRSRLKDAVDSSAISLVAPDWLPVGPPVYGWAGSTWQSATLPVTPGGKYTVIVVSGSSCEQLTSQVVGPDNTVIASQTGKEWEAVDFDATATGGYRLQVRKSRWSPECQVECAVCPYAFVLWGLQ